MPPKVSVIIPVYNTQDYIVDCVASVVNQTYPHLEILIIDDGTPDHAIERVQKTFSDERIRILHQENQGISAARNLAIQEATGEYFFFLDSDDAIVDEAIERLVAAIDTSESLIVMGNHIKASSIDQVDFDEVPQQLHVQEVSKDDIFNGLFFDQNMRTKINFSSVWGKLYHHSLVRHHLFPIGRVHEDEFVNYLYFYEAKRVYFIDAPFYFYRDNPNGTVSNIRIKNIVDIIDSAIEKYQFFLEVEHFMIAQALLTFILGSIENLVRRVDFETLPLSQQIYYYTIYKTITEDAQ